jgi:FkbM family methyltransferase
MKIEDIERINNTSIAAIRAARDSNGIIPVPDLPYYGYVNVDIFDCPEFVMFSNNDSPAVMQVYSFGAFEPQSMRLWCKLARSATGICDIGASVGMYSLSAAALRPDLAIHAFEPNPYAFSRLRMHKMINKFMNIQEHTFAVGNNDVMASFAWVIKPNGYISSGGSVGVAKNPNSEQIVVPMRKLDGTGLAATLGTAPLIKIDVEGGEANVFAGMKEVIASKPDIILESFSSKACDSINQVLMPMGYSAYLIEERERTLTQRDKLYPCSTSPPYNYNQFLTLKPKNEVEQLLTLLP